MCYTYIWGEFSPTVRNQYQALQVILTLQLGRLQFAYSQLNIGRKRVHFVFDVPLISVSHFGAFCHCSDVQTCTHHSVYIFCGPRGLFRCCATVSSWVQIETPLYIIQVFSNCNESRCNELDVSQVSKLIKSLCWIHWTVIHPGTSIPMCNVEILMHIAYVRQCVVLQVRTARRSLVQIP